MKTLRNIRNIPVLLMALACNSATMAQERTIKGQDDPQILKEIRPFLKAVNTSAGKPIEQLSPTEARQVLIGAQSSVQVDHSGIEESERTISQNGYRIKIHIRNLQGLKPTHLYSSLSMAAAGYLEIIQHTGDWSGTWS